MAKIFNVACGMFWLAMGVATMGNYRGWWVYDTPIWVTVTAMCFCAMDFFILSMASIHVVKVEEDKDDEE